MKTSSLMLLLATLCQGAPAAPAVFNTNGVTVQSILSELDYGDVRTPHLLSFKAEEDHGPRYIERGLLALELTNGTWRLSHVNRTPKETPEHLRRWRASRIYDAPHVGDRNFNHRPTKEETEQFLKDTWWEFGVTPIRLIRGEVFTNTWERVLGYTPDAFSKPKS